MSVPPPMPALPTAPRMAPSAGSTRPLGPYNAAEATTAEVP